ncbi:hypothetical protein Scep_030520 [Stephania cephalantha]|uniref:Uncharacterized protein n=1 Tax=Stephania cephalantha TaxID=152367 RepID=A0AAP0DZS6_9MAGN
MESFSSLKKSRSFNSGPSVSLYAVQCGKCLKWRVIPTKEEYELIRTNFLEDPWFCDKRSDVSCEDPSDIEYDSSRTWAIDKPNIPEVPEGFKRILVPRRDLSKIDVYYVLPTGRKAKSLNEVEKFLEANPIYKADGVDISMFSFTTPKILGETVPGYEERKASGSSNKKPKMKEEDKN